MNVRRWVFLVVLVGLAGAVSSIHFIPAYEGNPHKEDWPAVFWKNIFTDDGDECAEVLRSPHHWERRGCLKWSRPEDEYPEVLQSIREAVEAGHLMKAERLLTEEIEKLKK